MRLLQGLLAALAILLVAGFVIVPIETRLTQEARRVQNALQDDTLLVEGEGAGRLFKDLVEQGLIQLDVPNGVLDVRDCDLGRKSEGDAPDDARRGLMTRLCRTPTGEMVQREVDLWNRGIAVAAVRDDFSNDAPLVWTMRLGRSGDPLLIIPPEPKRTPLVEIFGFAVMAGAGLGEWSAIDSAGIGGRAISVSTVVPAGKGSRRLEVQVIGRITGLRVGGQVRPLVYERSIGYLREAVNFPLKDQVSQTTVLPLCRQPNRRLGYRCPVQAKAKPDQSDAGPPDDGSPRVDTVRIELPEQDVEIELAVRPTRMQNSRILRLKPSSVIERTSIVHRAGPLPTDGYAVRHGPERILLRCLDRAEDETTFGSPVDQCRLDWRLPAPHQLEKRWAPPPQQATATLASGHAAPGYTIATAGPNPVVLATHERNPNEVDATRKLGLVKLIGRDETNPRSLSQAAHLAVVNGKGPVDVSLTIDRRMQEIALKRLRTDLSRNGRFGRLLPRQYEPERRAAIVLMSADRKNAGEILAAAEWPPPPDLSLSSWNQEAFERFGQGENPFAIHAWTGADGDMAPGSSFKIVSALAILQAAADGVTIKDETGTVHSVEDLVRGMPKDASARILAVDLAGCPAPPSFKGDREDGVDCLKRGTFARSGTGIRNNNGQSFNTASIKLDSQTMQSASCKNAHPDGAPEDGIIGLRHALATSSNIWFAGMMDRLPRDQDGKGTRWRSHYLSRAIHAAFNGLDASDPAGIPLAVHPAFKGQSLHTADAQKIHADFELNRKDAETHLLLASYGMTVRATPTAMASIAASIALGRAVRPTLMPNQPQIQTRDLLNAPAFKREQLLDELRCGMKAVVTVGTAKGHVAHELIDGMYGKTGTAQVNQSYVTVWFVGWYEDTKSFDGRRIAFACMVTHVNREGGGGGSMCAPIISDLLLELGKVSRAGDSGQPASETGKTPPTRQRARGRP